MRLPLILQIWAGEDWGGGEKFQFLSPNGKLEKKKSLFSPTLSSHTKNEKPVIQSSYKEKHRWADLLTRYRMAENPV